MSKQKDKIWMLRKDGKSNGYVKTTDDRQLHIYYYQDNTDTSSIVDFTINRNDARALAKRIMECLNDSK